MCVKSKRARSLFTYLQLGKPIEASREAFKHLQGQFTIGRDYR
jgi:hypothetical protein